MGVPSSSASRRGQRFAPLRGTAILRRLTFGLLVVAASFGIGFGLPASSAAPQSEAESSGQSVDGESAPIPPRIEESSAAERPPPSLPLPPRPADSILDEGRIFSTEQRSDLAAALARYRDQYDIDICVAAYSYLMGERIHERAARLKESWISTSRGVVLVYLRGSQQMTFAASENMEDFLPRSDLIDVFTVAAAAARGQEEQELTHPDRITIAATKVAEGLHLLMSEREAVRKRERLEFVLFLAGFCVLLVALLAVGAMLYRIHNRIEDKCAEFYYFPPVKVGTRLGAPFGGGAVAEVSFDAAGTGESGSSPGKAGADPSRNGAGRGDG